MSDAYSTSSQMQPHPALAALATTLQGLAQSLLAHTPQVPEDSATNPAPARNEGETRSFYFSPAAVHLERELLRKYRVDDFQGLLEEVYTLLIGLVKLMQSVHKDVRVKGYVISSLDSQIEHASALVLRMRHVYDRVVPVEV